MEELAELLWERAAHGTAALGPPGDWTGRWPAPFEDAWPFLDQTRAATRGASRHGLRDAARQRR